MNHIRGMGFALASMALVSAAQLGMRWSMTRLPPPSQWIDAWNAGRLPLTALVVVTTAILAYGLSMGCWLLALRDVPLGRAYALLSISYGVVYLLAAALPVFNEAFTSLRSLGVALVILGVLIIHSPRSRHGNS